MLIAASLRANRAPRCDSQSAGVDPPFTFLLSCTAIYCYLPPGIRALPHVSLPDSARRRAQARAAGTTPSAAAGCPPAERAPQTPGTGGDRRASHRVTVFGSTLNIVATSAGVSSGSASGVRADIVTASPPGPVLRSCVLWLFSGPLREPAVDVLYSPLGPYCHHQR
jgi:hypothetical protein